MSDMPRPRKPYVHRDVDRHGNVRWYYRKPGGRRHRLPGAYESPEWLAAYHTVLTGKPPELQQPMDKKSLRWLCGRYFRSTAFHGLAESTKAQRRNILKNVCKTAGHAPYRSITRKDIAQGRDRRADTPAAAYNYLRTMGYLFEWAVDADYLEVRACLCRVDSVSFRARI